MGQNQVISLQSIKKNIKKNRNQLCLILVPTNHFLLNMKLLVKGSFNLKKRKKMTQSQRLNIGLDKLNESIYLN